MKKKKNRMRKVAGKINWRHSLWELNIISLTTNIGAAKTESNINQFLTAFSFKRKSKTRWFQRREQKSISPAYHIFVRCLCTFPKLVKVLAKVWQLGFMLSSRLKFCVSVWWVCVPFANRTMRRNTGSAKVLKLVRLFIFVLQKDSNLMSLEYSF